MVEATARFWIGRFRRASLAAGVALGLAACEMPPGTGAEPGSAYVLTSTGNDVLSTAPPGIEVFLGSKQVRPAGEPGEPEPRP